MCCASRPTPCSKATGSWSSTRDTWWRGRSRPACATGSTPRSRRASARVMPSSCRSTAPRSGKECAPSSATKRARRKTARPGGRARRDRAAGAVAPLPGGRPGRAGPAGHQPRDPRRRLPGPHGAVRVGEINPASHPRLPRPPDHRPVLPGGPRGGAAPRGRAGGSAQPQDRLRVPVLPPHPPPDRRRERRAADGPRRHAAGGAPRAGREGPAGGRTDRPRRAPSRSALGRPAPARGDRPRHGHGTVHPPGRRADREPRPRLRSRDHRADREDEPRGVDARGGHTRPGDRREGAAHPEARGRAHLLGREGGMNALDLLRFAWGALKGHRLRTALTLLGMAIGVGAVILLTALGEGARGYVTNEFMALGSNLLIVLPGKTETTGNAPILGGTTRPLTLEDCEAITRRVPRVRRLAPLSVGSARVGYRERRRQVDVLGATPELLPVRLFRILIEVGAHSEIDAARREVMTVLKERHDGEEDVTVLTQDSVLGAFNRILGALTLALAGIAAISLSVAGIGIMNVMLVSVSERTPEVGLLKALGAPPRQILRVFLVEAVLLSAAGGLLGLLTGYVGSAILSQAFPALPAHPPTWAVIAALVVSLAAGALFGVLPARRAARLDPVVSLAGR